MHLNLAPVEVLMNENSGVERIITDFYAILFMNAPLALYKRFTEGLGCRSLCYYAQVTLCFDDVKVLER